MCVDIELCLSAPLTDLSQQSKDVEDKLGELIPWLIKLNGSVTTASADGNREEQRGAKS